MDNRSKSVKTYDQSLRRSLASIFRSLTSDQIKEFLSRPELAHNNAKVKLALNKERVLSENQFSKEEFGKLSLLWIAVLGDYKDSAELLVSSGADVNEPFGPHDPQVVHAKSTVLHHLIKTHSPLESDRLIHLIADHGADLQARDGKGRTVLHYAVRQGVRMTEIFLEKGANTDVADNDGKTPLLAAASGSKAVELLPLFMKYGADVTVKDSNNRNVLHYLGFYILNFFNDNVDLPRALIESGVSLDDKDLAFEYQPLHTAAFIGKEELVKLYLDYGANVNEQTIDGETALSIAVRYSGNADLTETLLRRGANPSLRAIDGRTALHAACLSQFVLNTEKHVELLLSAGADVLAEDDEGNTPLALVNRNESLSIRLLIEMLALRKACRPSLELKDDQIIEKYPEMSNHFRECTEEIDKMKRIKLTPGCTLFDILSRKQHRIAALMRNPEFERKFRLSGWRRFPTYAEHVERAFERARELYRRTLKQEDLINEAFYGGLSWIITRRMAEFSVSTVKEKI